MMKKTPYEKWMAGEKVFKAPWVIRHYKSITDINQYKLSRIVEGRCLLFIGVFCFCSGLYFGFFIFG